MAATVMTVRGPVATTDLGVTPTHEHLFVNALREYQADGFQNDVELAVSELVSFRRLEAARS